MVRNSMFAALTLASVAASAAMSMFSASASAEPADLLIKGGPIYTNDDAHPNAQIVLVGGGRILYAGDEAGGKAMIGPGTKTVDLKGAALFPGFTDAHVHLDGVGERELTLNLEGSASIVEVQKRLKDWLAKVKPGEVVVGRGWIETAWPEKRFLAARDIDAVAPNNPVLLRRADGHAIVANSMALKQAGITDATQPPFGGALVKDEQGHITGMLVDHAMSLADKLIPKPDEAYRIKALKAGMAVENRYGWTGVHFMSAPWEAVMTLESLAKNNEAPLRVYAAVDRKDVPKLFASGPHNVADGRITLRAIKLYADGALGSRGAALYEPYSDQPDSKGLMLQTPEDTLPILREAAAKGIQVCTHAIGDRGNGETLDLYAQTLPQSDARWRIEHAQNIRASDIPRFAQMKVIASMQPSHAIGDLHFAPARLGIERLSEAYLWKSLLQAGALMVGGSDAPVERGDPMIEFYAAVARKDLKGYSGEGWHPEQALSRAEALKLFTSSAAYARFAENELGSITAGKRADLTAFSVDIMTAPEAEIPKGHATLTMVDGKIVYQD